MVLKPTGVAVLHQSSNRLSLLKVKNSHSATATKNQLCYWSPTLRFLVPYVKRKCTDLLVSCRETEMVFCCCLCVAHCICVLLTLLIPLLLFVPCEEVWQNDFVSHQVSELNSVPNLLLPPPFFFFKVCLVLLVVVIPYCLLPVLQ